MQTTHGTRPHLRLALASGRAREAEGVTLGVLALLVGGAGEALLFVEGGRLPGALVLGAAMLLVALAWGRIPETPLLMARAPAEGAEGARPIAWRRGLALRLAGISGALLLWWGYMLAWLADPGAVFGLQGAL